MANQIQKHQAWDGAIVSGTSILEAVSISVSASAATDRLDSPSLLIDTSQTPSPATSTLPSFLATSSPSTLLDVVAGSTTLPTFATPTIDSAAITTAINDTTSSSSSEHKKSGPSSALYISLIVLSILILLTLLTLAWFALRRKRKEKSELEETTQQRAPGTTLKSKDSFQDSPTLSGRTLVVPEPPALTTWPLRSISRHKSNRILVMPPAPPPKSEARCSAPPSSPTQRGTMNAEAGLVGVHIPATELSELSPVSPLCERDMLMKERF